MAKTVKLIMITPDNNNKYYDMVDLENGTLKVEYGRVGVTKQTGTYPSSKWNSIYNSKVKKGYKDVTELFIEDAATNVSFLDISDSAIKGFVDRLQAYARKQVATNYNVTADKVTQKQVHRAQEILNLLLEESNGEFKTVEGANKLLIELYSIIPRKMVNVNYHLLAQPEYQLIVMMIAREQDLLDTMASQVKQAEVTKANTDDSLTLLDALGLEVFSITSAEVEDIKSRLTDVAPRFVNAFRVSNKNTQKKFDDWVARSDNRRTELFFHGSRNENWMSILETGLVLRPTNAVISGKMFGYGSYYADKAMKSLGYTSLHGSYWARGNSPEAYMALFDVHLGNALHIKKYEPWCSQLTEASLKARGPYDSLFAEGGIDLRNNEYIVYNEAQSTVKYMIQLKG